jgi:hypothetical protein
MTFAGVASGLLALAATLFAPLPTLAASDNGAAKWKVWTYNPSGRAFKGSVPANATPNAVATFSFPLTPDTALLVTDHGSYKGTLLGDLTDKTLSAKMSDSGGPFTYYGQPDACNAPPQVRFYFQTKSPSSFNETDYWWSNPVSLQLDGLTSPTTMSVAISDGSKWSDFFGHFGNDPTYAPAFNAAVKDVTSIGVSFGGGCFFENGVGAPNGGSFTLWSFGASP